MYKCMCSNMCVSQRQQQEICIDSTLYFTTIRNSSSNNIHINYVYNNNTVLSFFHILYSTRSTRLHMLNIYYVRFCMFHFPKNDLNVCDAFSAMVSFMRLRKLCYKTSKWRKQRKKTCISNSKSI